MAHSYTSLYCHIVYATKNREPVLAESMRSRLLEYSGGMLRADRCSLIAGSALADHVHLLMHAHPPISLSALLRDIKARTSKWAKENSSVAFGWQGGYGAFTVSKSAVDEVTRYINKQEEHHRRMTFQEELVALLERHGIEYDPKYLWVD